MDRVPCVKSDAVVLGLQLKGNERVCFIKLDVQGAESKVLQGAFEVLKYHRPIVVFEHEDKFYERPSNEKLKLKEFFTSIGYKVFVISKRFPKVAFPVDWAQELEVDLIAVPICRPDM